MTKKVAKQKGNKNKELKKPKDDSLLNEVVTFIAGQEEHLREDKVLMLVLLGMKPTPAARLAGYSESYSRFGIHRKLRESKMFGEKLEEILGKMPSAYRQYCAARLFRVAGIEDKALQEMENDPTLAVRHPQILRQLKVTCGALTEEGTRPHIVSIQTLNFLQTTQEEGLNEIVPKPEEIEVFAPKKTT